MKNLISLITLCSFFFLSGCATVFKGYYDDVTIQNPPEGLEIYTKDNVRISLRSEGVVKGGSGNPYEYVPLKVDTSQHRYFIMLRSSEDQTLVLKYSGKEKKIALHKKVGFGWVLIDILTGGFPLLFDGYTGNWHHFDSINESFE